MASSVAEDRSVRHRVIPEMRPEMAKADLRKPEIGDLRKEIGSAIVRARDLLGWSQDRLAQEVKRDARQVARWERGDERDRVQMDTLWAVEELRGPLVVALAELASGAVEVETVMRFRRIA